MTEIRNFKPVLDIEYWILRFICYLVLVICYFLRCCVKQGLGDKTFTIFT